MDNNNDQKTPANIHDSAAAAAKPMSSNYNETVVDWTKEFIEPSLKEIEKAILQIPDERFHNVGEPFAVAEFGCSTGAASITTLSTVIKVVRSRNPLLPIIIYLNDLPQNHHELALQTVTEGLQKQFPLSLVYFYIAGKDFTTQVFPHGFLDFAFSNMALSTLFCIPTPWPNCYFQGSPANLAHPEGKLWYDAFIDQFNKFMNLRALELKPHGLFSLVTQIYVPQYQVYHSLEDQFYHGLYTLLEQTLTRHQKQGKAKDCIYTWCVMPKDIYVNGNTEKQFKVIGKSEYMVEDPYNGDPDKIANFIEGYWLETFESVVKDKKISEEFFGKLLK